MKKRIVTISIILSMILMTGCQGYPLTDEETDRFAEYVAGFVLDHEKNYEEKLFTPTPVPTEPPTPRPTRIPTSTPKPTPTKKATQGGAGSGNKEEELNIASNANFTEIIGIDGIAAEYSSYEIVDSYLSEEGIQCNAVGGYKLMVVKFSLKNTASKEIAIALDAADIRYRLNINNKTLIGSDMTIVDNDLNLLSTTLKSGASMEGIQIFSIPDRLNVDTLSFVASKGTLTAVIPIKE